MVQLDLPTLRSYNHPLRLCLGAFRTSPAVSLCVQATEPPLALRRKKLAYNTALSSVQIQITRHTMQFLIQSLKLCLTTRRTKLAHWALELKTTCRISALRKRMFYLQPFPQFHLDFSNALTVTSVYAVTIKQQKFSNANSLSFAQSFHTIYTDGSKDGIRTAFSAT